MEQADEVKIESSSLNHNAKEADEPPSLVPDVLEFEANMHVHKNGQQADEGQLEKDSSQLMVPEVEHRRMSPQHEALDHENELKAANKIIEDLQKKLSQVEEALRVKEMESAENTSSLLSELQNARIELEAALNDQSKLKSFEREAAHLAEEVSTSKVEAADLKGKVQETKEHNEQLTNQVEELSEKVHKLEELLATTQLKARESEERLEAHRTDLIARESNEERLRQAHDNAQVDLEALKSRALQLETALSAAVEKGEQGQEQAKIQESLAKESFDRSVQFQIAAEAAEEKIQEAHQSIMSLECEIAVLNDQIVEKAEIEKVLRETKDQVSKFEEECYQLKERVVQLEQEYDEKKIHILQLESKLNVMEEAAGKHIDSLKVAEEIADKFKGQFLDLETMLKITQDKLKSKEAATESLLLELSELKVREETLVESLKEAEAKSKIKESELQEMLEASEGRCRDLDKSLSELEENSAQLKDSFLAAKSEAEKAMKKVDELEIGLENLCQSKCELEERLSNAEEKSLHHETNAGTFMNRSIELESMVTQHKTEAHAATNKVTDLETALLDAHKKISDIEGNLKLAQDNLMVLENTVSQLSNHNTNLEDTVKVLESQAKEFSEKVTELQTAYACSKQREQELTESLKSADQRMVQKENTEKESANRILELEESIAAVAIKCKAITDRSHELELALEETRHKELLLAEKIKDAEQKLLQQDILLVQARERGQELERVIESTRSVTDDAKNRAAYMETLLTEMQEKFDLAELGAKELTVGRSLLEEKLAELEAENAKTAAELALAYEKIAELQPMADLLRDSETLVCTLTQKISAAEERVNKTESDLQAAILRECKSREEVTSHQISNSNLQVLLAQIENEKAGFLAQLDNTQKCFAELKEQGIQEKQQLRQQIATIMEENGNLSAKVTSLQGQLHDALVAAEASAKKIQESSLREAALDGEVEDLKVQLEKAVHECSNIQELEQKLKDSVSKEEHQAQVDQLKATSRSFESKLVEAEDKMSKTNLEIHRVQTSYLEQVNLVKELEPKAAKWTAVYEQPSVNAQARDFKSTAGTARQRKKNALDKEVDNALVPEVKEKGKHPHLSPHKTGHMLFVLLCMSLLSLLVGFWIAPKVGLHIL